VGGEKKWGGEQKKHGDMGIPLFAKKYNVEGLVLQSRFRGVELRDLDEKIREGGGKRLDGRQKGIRGLALRKEVGGQKKTRGK